MPCGLIIVLPDILGLVPINETDSYTDILLDKPILQKGKCESISNAK